MDAAELVRKALQAAVATDDRDRILAANPGFCELVGWSKRRPPTGELLRELLEARDVFGNRLAPAPLAVWETLVAGEGIHRFELQVTQADGQRVRVSVSPVVVLGSGKRSYQIVYLLEPVRRRRRADEVIDRLLAVSEPGAAGGLPTWWNERHVVDAELTRRQVQVLRRLAHGESPRAIAVALGMSVQTARSHVQAIYSRLGVHSRAAAVAWALRHQVL
ncbi:MAG: LuxR C-terminal-related transcriptional regulator [Thermoanaerobaculia bacterium]